jgi:hypothetical protein
LAESVRGEISEQNDTTEKVEMIQSQLHFIHYACEEILDYIDDGGEVEEWYQVKVAKSFSEFESLHSFIEGEKRRTGMVKEAMLQPDYSQSIKARQAKADKENAPFDVDKKPVVKATPGKHGIGPSTAKHLAKMAMQKQMKKEETELDEVSIPTNTYRPRESGRFVTRKYKGQTHEKDPHGGGMLAKTKPAMNKEDVEQIAEGDDYSVTVTHVKADKSSTKHDYHIKNANDARHAKNIAINRHTDKVGIKPGEQIHAGSFETRKLAKEEVEQIDEISSELAMKVSDGRFKRAMAMDRNDPKKPEATAKLSRAGASARKRITRDMIKDPEWANRGFASDADKNTKRGWSNESVEQIDELSKSTLGSYLKKASKQKRDAMDVINRDDVDDRTWVKNVNIASKRKDGSNAAAKRLGYYEEVEQIDELSKKTLGSYIKSASHDVAAKAAATRQHAVDAHRKMADQDFTGGRESMKKSDKSFSDSWKRRTNMAKAVDRLTKEDIEQIDEKNVPTSPEKWAQAKAQAKAKFDVYPSAYANGWAAKKYKEMGGGWKSVNEAEEPATETFYKSSRKAQIVKDAAKKKKESADTFHKEPIISKTEVKM